MSGRDAPGDGDRRLLEAGMVLASELSLDAVLQRIVELAVDLTGARYGALGVLTPDGRSIHDFITVGITPEERAALGDPPVGHGLLGALTRSPHPIRIPDIGADPRSVGFPPNHPPMKSLLGARIIGRGTVFGNLYLTDKQAAEMFDEEDERVLVVLATQAAIAVENGRLYDETERKGRELQRLQVLEERERIGKELHDGVIQSLFAVGMNLQGLATSSGDTETAGRLEAAVEDIDRAIRDLRNYIFGLRPGILADRQLDQALKEMASEFGSRTGIVTVAEVDNEAASILASRAGDVVQLAREALSNVSRHGDAATCRVSLRRGDDGLVLEIDDDGRGFDVETTSWGMGLRNLRERVESLGGVLVVESTAGKGRRSGRRSRREPDQRARLLGYHRRMAGPKRHPLRVMLVDDHEVVRDGIRAMLGSEDDIHVTAEAGTVREAIDEADRTRPDVVVMDVRLTDGSGIEATREIRAKHPDTRVLMLTSFADDEALFSSIMAGASGYVLKQVRSGELVRAIRAVGAGDSLLDPAVTTAVLDRLRKGKHLMRDEKLARLSPQEERVLTLIAEGRTNKEVGDELHLAEKTVKNYVSSILSKLEVARPRGGGRVPRPPHDAPRHDRVIE
jgi:DNA-binding NarL/FixJ family response regulator/signal transduction histidine kinase